jgi:hypothetical protein
MPQVLIQHPNSSKESTMHVSPTPFTGRLSRLTLACLVTFSMAPWMASASPVAPKSEKKTPSAGIEVKVTPEMTGAGIVSSGAVLPPIPPVTGSRAKMVPSWGKPLPYPIMIADRRNNRLIEVAPDKSIIWEFPSPNLKVYRGNEDVNFSADGKLLAVSEEDNFDIHIVDYETRALTWTYGKPDHRGSGPGLMNYPDDAHLLADGKFITADIRNCRVLIVDPKTDAVTTQWGTPGKCKHNPPSELGWSGRKDSNLRPSGPKPDALPGCATPRRVCQACCVPTEAGFSRGSAKGSQFCGGVRTHAWC